MLNRGSLKHLFTPCLLAILSFAGCGTPEDRYLPPEQTARLALEAALASWKSNAKLATITTGPVPVDTFDARWREGQVLESYEILDFQMMQDRPAFRVKMGLKGDPVVEDTFVVVGVNPLLVFRKQDFDKASGL
ncbi:MAG: hypothetical protein ACKO2P_12685 [Planctomycetota bacterium]